MQDRNEDTTKDYESIVKRIVKFSDSLNDWEVEFISSIYKQVIENKKKVLTPKQEEKLLAIHKKTNKYGAGFSNRSWR